MSFNERINTTKTQIIAESFSSQKSVDWTPGSKLSSYGCDIKGKFTVFTHGWNDLGFWVEPFVENILKYRTGCLVFLNYTNCFDMNNYGKTLDRFKEISNLLLIMLHSMENEGIESENIFMYGFSLGARAVIDAAINFGKQKIGSIDGEETFI